MGGLDNSNFFGCSLTLSVLWALQTVCFGRIPRAATSATPLKISTNVLHGSSICYTYCYKQTAVCRPPSAMDTVIISVDEFNMKDRWNGGESIRE